MLQQFIPLYNLDNGVFMIGVFVLVCIILIVGVTAMVFGGEEIKKDN